MNAANKTMSPERREMMGVIGQTAVYTAHEQEQIYQKARDIFQSYCAISGEDLPTDPMRATQVKMARATIGTADPGMIISLIAMAIGQVGAASWMLANQDIEDHMTSGHGEPVDFGRRFTPNEDGISGEVEILSAVDSARRDIALYSAEIVQLLMVLCTKARLDLVALVTAGPASW